MVQADRAASQREVIRLLVAPAQHESLPSRLRVSRSDPRLDRVARRESDVRREAGDEVLSVEHERSPDATRSEPRRSADDAEVVLRERCIAAKAPRAVDEGVVEVPVRDEPLPVVRIDPRGRGEEGESQQQRGAAIRESERRKRHHEPHRGKS